MVRAPDSRLLGFLTPYDRHIAELTLAVREVVLEEAPDAIESIYDAYSAVAIGFSFTGRLKDTYCHIATCTNHVNLGFNRGTQLPDPNKVLVGTGKWTRHIRIDKEGDLRQPYLPRYIQAAIEQVERPAIVSPASERVFIKGNYPNKKRPQKL